MKCPGCSFDIPPSSAQCTFCNRVLEQAAAEEPAPPEPFIPFPSEEDEVDLSDPRAAFRAEQELLRPATPIPTLPAPVDLEMPPIADRSSGNGLQALVFTALAAAVGAGYYYFAPPKHKTLAVQTKPVTAEAPAPPQVTLPSQPAPEPAVSQEPAPAPVVPTSKEIPDTAPKMASKKPARPSEWTFEGTVYDMISLKPVASAELTFSGMETGEEYKAVTNARGRYRLRLPATAEGYSVAISHPDYREKYFDEIAPAYKTLELADRQALQNAAEVRHPRWTGKKGRTVSRDFVLYPEEGVSADDAPPAEQ